MRIEVGEFEVQTASTLFSGDHDVPLMRFMNALYCPGEEDVRADLGFPSS